MPIYEYQCQSCDHEMEALQKMSDAALVGCPACGKSTLRKRISAAGFRLSGSGWYETDFKSGKKKNLVENKDTASADKKGDKGDVKKSAGEAGSSAPSKTSSKTSSKNSADA